MVARYVLGTLTGSVLAGALTIAPALAGQMNADEARRFVAGKVFAFTCFDGTRGAGRIFEDGGAGGSIQFAGAGQIRHMRLPGNTLQVRGQQICASIKGIPFEPCFNLNKTTEASFRGAVSGMGFAYCDFNHQGAQQMLMARANIKPRGPRSLRAPGQTTASAETSRAEVTSRVETPRVEIGKIEPARAAPVRSTPAAAEAAPELRRSTE